MSLSLISFQMIRVISSPSISTTGLVTLIFAIEPRSVGARSVAGSASERGERGVLRGARPHRGRCLGGIGQVVTADVDRMALRADQFAIDLGLVFGERLGQRFEAGRQLRVLGLCGQRLSPVQGEVEMGTAIIEFADLACRRAVEREDLADGRVERLSENLSLGVVVGLRQMFERRAERQEFAERIPAEIALFLELLHVLWCRAASTGLEKTAARQQRNDR